MNGGDTTMRTFVVSVLTLLFVALGALEVIASRPASGVASYPAFAEAGHPARLSSPPH